MSKAFDAIMKILEDDGELPDEKAKAIIAEHGPLSNKEKKQIAAALKMRQALRGSSPSGPPGSDEVTMDDYIQALSVLDSADATEEERKQAESIRDRFEGL